MTAYGPGEPRAPAVEAAAGIARLEGYLLAHRVRTEATEAGAVFADRFPWLGPRERSEIAREFAREHLAVRRRMLRDAAARADGLRREYGDRYARLRRRLLAVALGAAGATTAVVSLVVRSTG
ncbi:hypothetical protein ACFYNX_24120 [Streptomyces sp. NPDC007872]|uniref:hypothetical protein n=1 Tax=Streptomyces sp. NPDC007872 TaxID=3364782 RepID=UPI001392D354|nr:hypothetical protein [Streptomyces sp. SID2131]